MRLLLAALLAIAAPGYAHAQEGVTYVPAGDPEMRAAFARARPGLPEFFARFAAPGPDESDFMVKFDLLPEPDKAEFIWAFVDSHDGDVTRGRIANLPVDKRFKLDQPVTLRDAELLDWSYWKGSKLVGAETLKVTLERIAPDKAAETRAKFGW